MNQESFERLVADARTQTMADLREALRAAPADVLKKLAVDLVPPLFRAGYDGELAATGHQWADAWARPRTSALPTFLVRVHRGVFSEDDAVRLREAMHGAHIEQAALVVISETPLRPGVRTALGSVVPWIVDTEGLINLMLNANLGITTHVYEAKSLDNGYFR